MKAWLFFIVLSFPFNVLSQTVEGIIIDGEGKPVQFASIQIIGNSAGTISNAEGKFILKTDQIPTKVKISCIGLESIILEIHSTEFLKINLEKSDNVFNEVVIMPDSSLKNIISQAYNSITENYMNTPYAMKGFFRNIHKVKEGDFIDFGEAYLKVYTEGYKNNKIDAQVEIIKARSNKNPYRDSLDNIRYYGGVFFANSNDPVKSRADYLNPKYFNKKFIYNLESLTTYDGIDSVYVIRYTSTDNFLSGKLWIERKSKAYVKVTNRNDKPTSKNLLLKEVESESESTYIREVEGKWYLLYSSYKRENVNRKTRKHIVHHLTFLTTDLEENPTPVPYENRISYGAVFSEVENNYDEGFFDDKNVMVADTSIQQGLKKMEDELLTYRKSNLLNSKRQKKSLSTIILPILSKFNFGYGIGFTPLKDISSTPVLFYEKEQIEQLRKENSSGFPFLNFQVGYSINRHLSISYSESESLSKDNLFKTNQIGIAYKQPLNKMGSPLYLSFLISAGMLNTGKFINEINQDADFRFSDKNFGQSINVYLGSTAFNLMPMVELSRKKGLKTIFINSGYYFNVVDKPMIFIEKKGFFSTKKDAFPVVGNKIFIEEAGFKPQIIKPLTFTLGIKFEL